MKERVILGRKRKGKCCNLYLFFYWNGASSKKVKEKEEEEEQKKLEKGDKEGEQDEED